MPNQGISPPTRIPIRPDSGESREEGVTICYN